MIERNTIRVAAAQFHVGADVEKNLTTCLRMLDKAAECNPDLVVLPEFCNHLSWYKDKQHCYDVSVPLGGTFLTAIASAVDCYVVVNCTVQREQGKATGSSLLFSPQGELLLDNTKQIYIGHENDFLAKATQPGAVIETPLGRIGLYACMDGVINETPRCLALNGAQLMLNSLNSFAADEGSLHVPVRAAENKVFVVAANKVGPLVPQEMVEEISAATGIPVRFLDGAGESQIVSPTGEVLARASIDKEEVVFADIEIKEANDKQRPDGTNVIQSRRPELYRSITSNPDDQVLPAMNGPQELSSAIVQIASDWTLNGLVESTAQAFNEGAKLVALPPLLGDIVNPESASIISLELIDALKAVCQDSWVATEAVLPCETGFRYCAVLVGSAGIVLEQSQIHPSERFAWSVTADKVETLQLPIGRIGLVTSDDSIYPETFRLLALAGVEVAVTLLRPLEKWELSTGLVERAAENRINLLAATMPSQLGTSLSASLQSDFTILTEWQERAFDGLLSEPIVKRLPSEPGIYAVTLFPANAINKVVSANTDLLADRPWAISNIISKT